ncbi:MULTISPECIES: hypothetical protein [Streptomyces]|uniref:Uncharacterized protein n=1 Tax=Streptomyces nymphaeiformis TaxID=2663842 RepID=A0A7W7X9Q3_9ACTN|nr:hypothetical protein [Streptomyces nymphaeiformis]MBB4980689.1 hypothetical protein [Streptomyces nymphaeiformis]
MTDASMPSPGTPRDVLAGLGDLTRKVRAAQRGTWFPLLLMGLLTLGGILVGRFTTEVETVPCPTGGSCTLVSQGSPVYWPVGLALAYTATAYFYVRRSRSRGVGTPVRPYVLTGIALVALSSATALWTLRHGIPGPGEQVDLWGLHLDPGSGVTLFLERLAGNATAVGLPLLVLARVERSRALLLLAVAYLAVELVPLPTGWAGIPATSAWASLPHFAVPGVLLLLGALGFRLAEPTGRRSAA